VGSIAPGNHIVRQEFSAGMDQPKLTIGLPKLVVWFAPWRWDRSDQVAATLLLLWLSLHAWAALVMSQPLVVSYSKNGNAPGQLTMKSGHAKTIDAVKRFSQRD
jgi:hypothetical protein